MKINYEKFNEECFQVQTIARENGYIAERCICDYIDGKPIYNWRFYKRYPFPFRHVSNRAKLVLDCNISHNRATIFGDPEKPLKIISFFETKQPSEIEVTFLPKSDDERVYDYAIRFIIGLVAIMALLILWNNNF